MALATQCPFCQTTFRVAQDQLKLRGGLVRCGNCREVFNGNDYLVAPEMAQQLVVTPTAPPAPTASASPATPASAWPPLPNATTSTAAPAATPPKPTTATAAAITPATPAAPAPAATTAPTRTPPATPDLSATFANIAAATSDAPWGDESVAAASAKPSATARSATAEAGLPAESTAINTLTQELSLPIPRTLSAPPEQDDRADDTDAAALEQALNELAATSGNAPAGLLKRATRMSGAEQAGEGLTGAGQQDAATAKEPEASQAEFEEQEEQAENEENGEEREDEDEAEDEEEAPVFVRQAQRRERLRRVAGIVMAIGAVLLSITLLLQALYLGRNQIAAWLPATRPLLSAVCARLHCSVGLPANIEQLSLESNELQLVPPNQNIYTLTVLLRNRSASAQTWPYLELTLNDNDEKPITRRVFTPREYLASVPQINAGFDANSEQQVKLNFELTQPVASGYRVYLFYP